jgi:hypothetical protein
MDRSRTVRIRARLADVRAAKSAPVGLGQFARFVRPALSASSPARWIAAGADQAGTRRAAGRAARLRGAERIIDEDLNSRRRSVTAVAPVVARMRSMSADYFEERVRPT